MMKKKYIRLINGSFLFFTSKKRIKIFENREKKTGYILNSKYPRITNLRNMTIWKNQLIEFELTILPSFQPNMEIVFPSNIDNEEAGLSDVLKIFFTKKFTIFCSCSLPLFKHINVKQCQILKIEVKLNKIIESDRILSEIYFEGKKHLKSEISLRNRGKIFSTIIDYKCILNGFLKFKNSCSYPINHISFFGFLKNSSLIWYNKGPEFRFNSRHKRH